MSQALGQVYATEYNGTKAENAYATCTEKRNVNLKVQVNADGIIANFTKKVVDNTVWIRNYTGAAAAALPGAKFQDPALAAPDILNANAGNLATNETYNTKHGGKLNGSMPHRLFMVLDAYNPASTPAGGAVGELAIRLLDPNGNSLVVDGNEGIISGRYVSDRTGATPGSGTLITQYDPATKTHYLIPLPTPAAATSFEIVLEYNADWIENAKVSLP